MNAPPQRRTVVFIVRVWAEYLSEQPPAWRGVLEAVAGGQVTPFAGLEELVEAIRQETRRHNQTENPKSTSQNPKKTEDPS